MKNNIYISSCTQDGGIYRFTLDDGKLCKTSDLFKMDRPMYTVISDNKLFCILRAPFENSDESGILSFDIDENGALCNKSDITPTKGIVSCHLCVCDDKVYAVNYLSGNVILLPDTVKKHDGKGPHPTRQTEPHTHFVCETPDKKYILVTDLGTDSIYVYTKDLSLCDKVFVGAGAGPRHLVFSDDGTMCYCANELESSVCAFSYDDGKLIKLFSESTLPDDFCGESTVAAIRYKDGFVYVSNRGHDSIACLKANRSELTLLRTDSCCGNSPRDFDIIDEYFICTNENDGSVTLLKQQSDKSLVLVDKIATEKALCVTICR